MHLTRNEDAERYRRFESYFFPKKIVYMEEKKQCVVYGQVPSKSNQYRIVTISGHGSLAKTDALENYEKAFYQQCNLRDRCLSGFFELYIDVYFQSDRSDLDNSLKVVLDCLQTIRAIKNDRQCTLIYARKFIDKHNPRIEFSIKEVGGVKKCDSKQPEFEFK